MTDADPAAWKSGHALEVPSVNRSPADTTPRPWPLLLLALPAFVAIWSGWVGLGELTGFGPIKPLPGTPWAGFTLNSAITLPIGVETYAAYALRVWLTGAGTPRAVAFARASAIGSLALGAAGQVAYHLMVAAGYSKAPWEITTLVACLPVAVLGMGATLAHMRHAPVPASVEASACDLPVPARPGQARLAAWRASGIASLVLGAISPPAPRQAEEGPVDVVATVLAPAEDPEVPRGILGPDPASPTPPRGSLAPAPPRGTEVPEVAGAPARGDREGTYEAWRSSPKAWPAPRVASHLGITSKAASSLLDRWRGRQERERRAAGVTAR